MAGIRYPLKPDTTIKRFSFKLNLLNLVNNQGDKVIEAIKTRAIPNSIGGKTLSVFLIKIKDNPQIIAKRSNNTHAKLGRLIKLFVLMGLFFGQINSKKFRRKRK